MGRIVSRVVVWLLMAAAGLYAADWVVWTIGKVAGAGMGTVHVSKMTTATLKKDKVEYYFDGEEDMACPISLFPQYRGGGWETPCWYLKRNPTVTTAF
jgi:hypothetical protein